MKLRLSVKSIFFNHACVNSWPLPTWAQENMDHLAIFRNIHIQLWKECAIINDQRAQFLRICLIVSQSVIQFALDKTKPGKTFVSEKELEKISFAERHSRPQNGHFSMKRHFYFEKFFNWKRFCNVVPIDSSVTFITQIMPCSILPTHHQHIL